MLRGVDIKLKILMRKVKSLLKETTPFQICSAPFLNSPEWDLFQNRSREKLWSCCSGERMFSVFYQQDLTKALFIICLFMQRVLQVPCNGRPSLLSPLSRLAKKAIGRKHTTFTSCKHAACSNELFSLSSRSCFGRHDLPPDARAFSFLAPLEM